MGEKVYPDFIQRDLTVKYQKKKHKVTHLHFLSWPDPGFPNCPLTLLRFCKKIRQEFVYSLDKPTVVRCNAGVGWSGTYILNDAMLEIIGPECKTDIYNYFQILRRDWMQMVQTTEQYIFIHNVTYEDTNVSSSKLKSELEILLKDQGNGKNGVFKNSVRFYQGSMKIYISI